MICPNCKNQLIKSITFKTKFLRSYKVYSFICGCCNFIKTIELRISKNDYENSIKDRTLKILNTKNSNSNLKTNKTDGFLIAPCLREED